MANKYTMFSICILVVVSSLDFVYSMDVHGNRKACETTYLSCNGPTCETTYHNCLLSNPLPVSYGVFPDDKKDTILNFKCCFKALTDCIIKASATKSPNTVLKIQKCKLQMYNCTIFNNKKYAGKKGNVKMMWIRDSPVQLQHAVLAHARCNSNSSMNDFCCSAKYQLKVEIMLLKECFHHLLKGCKTSSKTAYDCKKQVWDKCINPDCKSCTLCDKPKILQKIPFGLRSPEAKLIYETCARSSGTVDKIMSCVMNLKIKDFPLEDIRRMWCADKISKLSSDSSTKLKVYKECMETNKIIDIGLSNCRSPKKIA